MRMCVGVCVFVCVPSAWYWAAIERQQHETGFTVVAHSHVVVVAVVVVVAAAAAAAAAAAGD